MLRSRLKAEGAYWPEKRRDFYGGITAMVSEDLVNWTEASSDKPLIGNNNTPGNAPAENANVIKDGDGYIMFFAPCRGERGLGMARSRDLWNWYDIHYHPFPKPAWLPTSINAPMVIDLREEYGRWLMLFHSDRDRIQWHSGSCLV